MRVVFFYYLCGDTLNFTTMEQILINYTKTEDSFLLAIINGDKSKVYNEETEEATAIVNQIKDIINH